MSKSALALPAPKIVPIMTLPALDMGALLDAIELFARSVENTDLIAAIRVDESACRAEMDVAAQPFDPRRLH
jgi:hypothetical protein